MQKAKLIWTFDTKQVSFRLEDDNKSVIQVQSWSNFSVQTDHGNGSIGHLLGLIDDDIAKVDQSSTVHISHAEVAAMDVLQLERLGLPPAAPHRLELRGSGLLSSSSFRFQHRLISPSGRPVLGSKRSGSILEVGTKTYTLLDPLYSIIEGIEAFNGIPPGDLDERFLVWADLKKLLPEDAEVDDHLRSMNIVRAESFSLDYNNDSQILPVLLSHTKQHNYEFDNDISAESLPRDAHNSFMERFERLSTAQIRYVLEGGWYVVVGEPLKKALQVVKDYQNKSIPERRALLDNPVGILKESLGDLLLEDEIEKLFEETPSFLSARIEGLGEWNPKLCAYVMPSRQTWLPPEEAHIGVPLQDKIVDLSLNKVPELLEMLKKAMERGEKEVVYDGQSVPASEETKEQLERIIRNQRKVKDDISAADGYESEEKKPELVPQIIDNIDDLGFEIQPRDISGVVGGIPSNIKSNLYHHQSVGLKWLQAHWASGSRGALLADDMGLGKTIQTLAFFAWVQEQMETGSSEKKPFLIVAPTGLLKNWEDESSIHIMNHGLGRLLKAYGPELKELFTLSQREQVKRIRDADWVMTTYETMRDRIKLFIGVDWGIVAFDEAQKIKNPTARMTEMAKSLNADFTLALTGTPVENRLADLWSILDTTNPGLLGSLKTFHETYEKPAKNNPESAAPLSKKVMEDSEPSIMLRRLKEDHLPGLPDKKEFLLEEEMSEKQAAAYSDVIVSAALREKTKGGMLEILHELRKISMLSEPLGAEGVTDEDVKASARLRAMIQILDTLKEKNEKVLIFVEFLDLQDSLVPYLQSRYDLPSPPMRISGRVSGLKRKKRVDNFQNNRPGEFDVMLLSPRAGGVGLTLTAANHVIHLTRWWNPAVEDQCTDRVYRIGQNKTVHVYLPLAIHLQYGEHSFDKNLHSLLETKRLLSRSVLAPPSATDADIGNLYESSINV